MGRNHSPPIAGAISVFLWLRNKPRQSLLTIYLTHSPAGQQFGLGILLVLAVPTYTTSVVTYRVTWGLAGPEWPQPEQLVSVSHGLSSSGLTLTCPHDCDAAPGEGEGPLRPRLSTACVAYPRQSLFPLPWIWVGLMTFSGQKNEAEVTVPWQREWMQEEVENGAYLYLC